MKIGRPLSEPPVLAMQRKHAFTLIELLVVVAIIVALIAILLPAMSKAVYVATTATCVSRQHQIAVGVLNYAADYERWYPYRGPSQGGHAFWWSGAGGGDVHAMAERYIIGAPVGNTTNPNGPADERRTPQMMNCPHDTTNFQTSWPAVGWNGAFAAYSSGTYVYAGWDVYKNQGGGQIARVEPGEMPLRMGEAGGFGSRPVSGCFVARLFSSGGWYSSHARDAGYHSYAYTDPPPDPIPYAFEDGSVRMFDETTSAYDNSWGEHHWPKWR